MDELKENDIEVKEEVVNDGEPYTVVYTTSKNKLMYHNINAHNREEAIKRFNDTLLVFFKMWYLQYCQEVEKEYSDDDAKVEYDSMIKVLDCNKV